MLVVVPYELSRFPIALQYLLQFGRKWFFYVVRYATKNTKGLHPCKPFLRFATILPASCAVRQNGRRQSPPLSRMCDGFGVGIPAAGEFAYMRS